jgi:hypothetical protein
LRGNPETADGLKNKTAIVTGRPRHWSSHSQAIRSVRSDVLIAPERNSHRTRTDLAVSEGYLIVAKFEIETSDKHDFFVYHIFHLAAGPAARVETGEAAVALSCFVDYFLRYVARHRFLIQWVSYGR